MSSASCQPRILAATSAVACSLSFRIAAGARVQSALVALQDRFSLDSGVVGIGEPLARACDATIPGLRSFRALSGPAISVPSTQHALWIFLQAAERGALFDAVHHVRALLKPAFVVADAVDTFVYRGGRDLTDYEDGTENPRGGAAETAALVGEGEYMIGSSFVAVQRWVHDLERFTSFPAEQRDATIGRRHVDNAEMSDAPASAHVKRSAQESFDPPAFVVRRSMPWATAHEQGLEFVAYCANLDQYERVLARMAGLEDGIADALFTFSRPVSGAYYWCPPVADGRLDLRALVA